MSCELSRIVLKSFSLFIDFDSCHCLSLLALKVVGKHMIRFFFFLIALAFSNQLFAQATLYSTTFEPNQLDWVITGDLTPNSYVKSTCAGNGLLAPGAYSLYVSQGGTTNDCGPTGQNQYAYTNAPSGTKQALAYVNIDGTCATGLSALFDYRIEGVSGEDFAEIIYSIDGGASWLTIGSALAISPSWTTVTVALPAALNSSNFLIGFRYTYNASGINGVPLAVDNFSVTGADNTPPVIVCPTSLVLPVSNTCAAIVDDYTKDYIQLSDNCTDSIDIVVTQNIPQSTILALSSGNSTSITLTATDESGNNAQCTFSLVVADITAPTIICPSNSNVYLNNACQAVLANYANLATVTDNCSGPYTFTQLPAPGTLINGSGSSTSVTLTVNDASSNSSQCSFTIQALDTIQPTLTCPPNQSVYANASCEGTLLNYTNLAIGSDNCSPSGPFNFIQFPLPGTIISDDKTITITMDGGGLVSPVTCQFTAFFIDTLVPSVSCPGQITQNLNAQCQTALPNYIGALNWLDNCVSNVNDMTFSQLPTAGTLINQNTTITLTATDLSGNSSSCTMIQLVVDTVPPLLTCPSNQTINANSACNYTLPSYLNLVTGIETCNPGNAISYIQVPSPGTLVNGNILVTINGSDVTGNTGSCTFQVNVIDAVSPTITCPTATSVSTNNGCNYTLTSFTSQAIVSDNCTASSNIIVSQNPSIGSLLPPGTQNITLTATDQNGNTGNCTFALTVADQVAPLISCPVFQNVPVNGNCSAILPNFSGLLTVSDNCSSNSALTFTQAPSVGSVINGNTQVTIGVTDAAGNSNTCAFTAVAIDATAPSLQCPTSSAININSSCQYLVPDLSNLVTGADNCSSFANMALTQNPIAGQVSEGMTAVLFTLTDQQGNASTCITMLTPNDTEVPTITCPNPSDINGSACNYTLPFYGTTALVLDNCPGFTITQTPAQGTNLNSGTHIITLDVTDAGGNTASCSFDLGIYENISPSITCPPNSSVCDPLVTYPTPVINDNCFAYLTQTDNTGLSSGDVFPVGITTLTYMVADSSGNSQICSFDIEVLEYPSDAQILEDTISLCEITNSIISAQAPTSGTGIWTVATGQGTLNNQFASTTGINNLGDGTNLLVWTVNSASCGSSADSLYVIVSNTPLPTPVGDTIFACDLDIIQLAATNPVYGIGTWSSTTNSSILSPNSPNSSVTNLSPGWNYFVWTITSGTCPTTADTLEVYATEVASIALNDTSICISDAAVPLIGNAPNANQSSLWSLLGGSAYINDVYASTTFLTDIVTGVNTIVYTLNHNQCPATTDTLVILANLCDGFNPVFPTVITPNSDGKNDVFVIAFLQEVYPNCHVSVFNRWGSMVYDSDGYETPWDGKYKGELLPMGTYFYKIELNDEEGTIYNGPISIIY